MDVATVMVIERSQPKHWYVWAGTAVVLGAGGVATYQYLGRSPVSIQGLE